MSLLTVSNELPFVLSVYHFWMYFWIFLFWLIFLYHVPKTKIAFSRLNGALKSQSLGKQISFKIKCYLKIHFDLILFMLTVGSINSKRPLVPTCELCQNIVFRLISFSSIMLFSQKYPSQHYAQLLNTMYMRRSQML